MQFSAIVAIAFSSLAVMASPSSHLDSLVQNKVARQECTSTTLIGLCTEGENLFCSNVNTGSRCPDGLVERFDDILTKINEEVCAGLTIADQCTMNVLCCPAAGWESE